MRSYRSEKEWILFLDEILLDDEEDDYKLIFATGIWREAGEPCFQPSPIQIVSTFSNLSVLAVSAKLEQKVQGQVLEIVHNWLYILCKLGFLKMICLW